MNNSVLDILKTGRSHIFDFSVNKANTRAIFENCCSMAQLDKKQMMSLIDELMQITNEMVDDE